MSSKVKDPIHYRGDGRVDCKRAMMSMLSASHAAVSNSAAYWWGCAFKYLWRWPWKNGREDLEKCKECIDQILDMVDELDDHQIKLRNWQEIE